MEGPSLTKSRLNYILWLQDLIDTTSTSLTERYDPGREVIGLDKYIPTPPLLPRGPLTTNRGPAASAIYPLLGTAARPKWNFIATGHPIPLELLALVCTG